MNLQQLLANTTVDTLDVEVLIAHVLQKNRSFIKAYPEHEPTKNQIKQIQHYLTRASNNEPIAYILGTKEFYGRDFVVTADTLIPRPCTETLIEAVLNNFTQTAVCNKTTAIDNNIVCWEWIWGIEPLETVIDVGTGTGVIGITIGLEATMSVICTDASKAAVEVCKQNIKAHNLNNNITAICEADFDTVKTYNKPFVVVSNPPYIPVSNLAEDSVHNYEPHEALYAGKEGIDVVLHLIQAARNNKYCQGVIIECQAEQPNLVLSLLGLEAID